MMSNISCCYKYSLKSFIVLSYSRQRFVRELLVCRKFTSNESVFAKSRIKSYELLWVQLLDILKLTVKIQYQMLLDPLISVLTLR